MIIDHFIEKAFDFITAIVVGLKLPELSLDFSVLDTFLGIISEIAYFFPVTYMVPMIVFIAGLQIYRVVISLLKLIASISPF